MNICTSTLFRLTFSTLVNITMTKISKPHPPIKAFKLQQKIFCYGIITMAAVFIPCLVYLRSTHQDLMFVSSVSEERTSSCVSAYPHIPCDAKEQEIRYDYFDCASNEANYRSLLNESVRVLWRGVYQGIVGPLDSTIGPFPSTTKTGFRVPFEAKISGNSGRSIWSTDSIRKGQLVWTSKTQTTCFHTGDQYRRFIWSLPPDIVCDSMQFSYVKEFPSVGHGRNLKVCLDTDESGYINNGGLSSLMPANIGCPEGMSRKDCDYGGLMYALRDIDEGEELLCDYQDFYVEGGWEALGL